MEDQFFVEGPAQGHDQPITKHGGPLARGRDVVKRRDTVPKATPDGLRAIPDHLQHLPDPPFANILQVTGQTGVDVVTRDSVGGGAGEGFAPLITAKALEHLLDHIALAVVRRRRMSKDQQFHGLQLGSFPWIFKKVCGCNGALNASLDSPRLRS